MRNFSSSIIGILHFLFCCGKWETPWWTLLVRKLIDEAQTQFTAARRPTSQLPQPHEAPDSSSPPTQPPMGGCPHPAHPGSRPGAWKAGQTQELKNTATQQHQELKASSLEDEMNNIFSILYNYSVFFLFPKISGTKIIYPKPKEAFKSRLLKVAEWTVGEMRLCFYDSGQKPLILTLTVTPTQ